jgi:hypothetical protein
MYNILSNLVLVILAIQTKILQISTQTQIPSTQIPKLKLKKLSLDSHNPKF